MLKVFLNSTLVERITFLNSIKLLSCLQIQRLKKLWYAEHICNSGGIYRGFDIGAIVTFEKTKPPLTYCGFHYFLPKFWTRTGPENLLAFPNCLTPAIARETSLLQASNGISDVSLQPSLTQDVLPLLVEAPPDSVLPYSMESCLEGFFLCLQ